MVLIDIKPFSGTQLQTSSACKGNKPHAAHAARWHERRLNGRRIMVATPAYNALTRLDGRQAGVTDAETNCCDCIAFIDIILSLPTLAYRRAQQMLVSDDITYSTSTRLGTWMATRAHSNVVARHWCACKVFANALSLAGAYNAALTLNLPHYNNGLPVCPSTPLDPYLCCPRASLHVCALWRVTAARPLISSLPPRL